MRRLLPAFLAIVAIVVSGALVSHAGTTFSGGGVADTRAINTTSPVAGGGDLSADRTLTFSNTYVDPSINGFRLSLTAGTAVTTADVTGATEINLVSFTANRIALWDGSEWDLLESDAVAPLALGTISDATNYDVYAYSNSGVITLDTPVAWTNDTTRATALVRQDGVWCQTGDLTRRYAGTFRTTATTTTEDSAARRFVFNAQNRVSRILYRTNTTSHTYNVATYRAWNNDQPNSSVNFVLGLAEDAPWLWVAHEYTGVGNVAINLGAALDVTNAAHTNPNATTTFSIATDHHGAYNSSSIPGIGYHYWGAVELGNAAFGTTWSSAVVGGRVMQ